MVISIIGETDKRPFVYTLLKACQYLGDVLFLTNNRHYTRVIEEMEYGVGVKSGHFQNIFIVVTDSTPDEAMMEVGYNIDDYEYIIYDNKVDAHADLTLYIAGCEMSEFEHDLLDYLEEGEDYRTIHFGFGRKGKIPYTAKMYLNCEIVETKRVLRPIDSNVSREMVKILSPALNIPVKTLSKVVSSTK